MSDGGARAWNPVRTGRQPEPLPGAGKVAVGLPLAVKIPDGSFSRGVRKVDSRAELERVADELFEETDLLRSTP
jgi:hypothetical protein